MISFQLMPTILELEKYLFNGTYQEDLVIPLENYGYMTPGEYRIVDGRLFRIIK